jgi:hypothetical protein
MSRVGAVAVSVFRIYLPALERATPRTPKAPRPGHTQDGETETILLVENVPPSGRQREACQAIELIPAL